MRKITDANFMFVFYYLLTAILISLVSVGRKLQRGMGL